MKHKLGKISLFFICLCFSSVVFAEQESNQQNNLLFDSTCGLNSKAAQLAALIISHPKQQRNNLTCHPILAITAAKKARSMASNQRVEHNLDYSAPNGLLEAHGYLLPAEFLPTSNQVESIAGGKKSAEETLHRLLNSHAHRSHILGLSKLNRQQINIGVGYYYNPDTPHEFHWAIHIAQPREPEKNNLTVDYLKSVTNYQAKPSE